MRLVTSIPDLFDPTEEVQCYVDRSFLFWGTTRGLGGHAIWGCPDADDASRFVAVLEYAMSKPDVHPRALVADLRELVYVDPGAFACLREHVARHRRRIERLRFRAAILRPDGLVGSVVAGFYAVAPRAGERQTFRDVDRALGWLGHASARDVFDEVDRARMQRCGAAPLVSRLRRLLHGTMGLTVAAAGAALGVSARSLQRELRQQGVSFRALRDEVRLARALELLRLDEKLGAVATTLGFSTPQHFATWFRRHTGESPSTWREESLD